MTQNDAHGAFQVDLRGMVDLLSHHLYGSPDVYVRELLQNAVDAVAARRLGEPGHAGAVELEVREAPGSAPTVVVSDNGIGLTEAELVELLSTIGRSSKRGGADGLEQRAEFIGRFGIGLLACFLVADEITVISRSALDPAAPAVRWRGRADGTYDTAVLDIDVSPGTRVHLRARPGQERRLGREEVLRLARRYGGLLPVPIRVIGGGDTAAGDAVVNGEVPPWDFAAGSLEQQRDVAVGYARRELGIDPVDVIALRAGGVRGLAFVLPFEPSPAARQNHRVYLRRMLLSESADRLLPDWAFFVRCVVDADELQPTAARDGFREDERLDEVRAQLGRCVRDHLVELARLRPERLASILSVHHAGIAALAVHDEECLRLFADWLPVETSLGRMTLGEHRRRFGELHYVRRVEDFRQVAPIAAAQDRCVVNAGYTNLAEVLRRLAVLEPERGIAELDPTGVIDAFTDLTLQERAEVHELVRIADLALQELGCVAEVRTFAPPGMPALYVTNEHARYRRDLDRARELVAGSPGTSAWGDLLGAVSAGLNRTPGTRLCLNLGNPVVRALAAEARTGSAEQVRRAVRLLYVQALLLGQHPLREHELGLLNDVILGFLDGGAR